MNQTTTPSGCRGVVLLGHGSRLASANAPLHDIAAQVSAHLGDVPVEVAYLQLAAPDLNAVLERCVAAGWREITVVPFFLFAGAHVREDVPALVAAFTARHPQVRVAVADVLGGHPKLAEVAADRAKEMMK